MPEKTNTQSNVTSDSPKPLSRSYELSIPDAYSNNSEIILGSSEVAITFLQDVGFYSEQNSTQKAIVRIVMTHEVFLNFVTYCNTRAKFIQDAYDGPIPSLSNKIRHNEEIQQSFEDMWAKKRVVAKFEFASDQEETI